MIEFALSLVILSSVVFVLVAFAGWLFSLASRRSVHVRWFLPVATVLACTYLFTAALGLAWGPWQSVFGLFAVSVWVVHSYRQSPRYEKRAYSTVWLRSVLTSTVFVVAFLMVFLFLIPHHHG